jgi:hypothetical protein
MDIDRRPTGFFIADFVKACTIWNALSDRKIELNFEKLNQATEIIDDDEDDDDDVPVSS